MNADSTTSNTFLLCERAVSMIDKRLFVVPVIGHFIRKKMISYPCKEKTGVKRQGNGGDNVKRLAFWLKKCFRKNNLQCRSCCLTCEYYEICIEDGAEFY